MLPDLLDIISTYVDPKTYLNLSKLYPQRYTTDKYETHRKRYKNKIGKYYWKKYLFV